MPHDYPPGSEDEVVGDVPAMPEGREGAYATGAEANRDVLNLPADLTIVEVAAFHAEISFWLKADCSIAIDGKAVEAIDGAGVQLLAAFIKDRVACSRGVCWVNASDVLVRAATQMGLHQALLLDQSMDVN